ncbi:hypothetical protein [Lutibacter flavus]|uniref:Uncharacterized protein n=1 Tax=Lutibacter flavus TaxID=691689 RepID=A0A238XHB2_9FLAO|nr:hypothetical protein [Lutibacter flavus]SNR58396.1 hypothetical protein SAMN04488111_1831 [Lutibacter flavus]
MDKINLADNNYDYLERHQSQLILFENIKRVSCEILFKEENKTKIINGLKIKIDRNEYMSFLSDNQKYTLINLGIEVVQNEIDILVLNKEKDILRISNLIIKEKFFNNFSKKIENLKLQIIKNKSDFNEVEKMLSNGLNSLEEVASIISVNNKQKNKKNIDIEISDFFNGENIEF